MKLAAIRAVSLLVLCMFAAQVAIPAAALEDTVRYLWSRDEPYTDGVTDVATPTFGDSATNATASCYWLIYNSHEGNINYMTSTVASTVGTPGADSFVYDIYISPTSVFNLTNTATVNADMSAPTHLKRFTVPSDVAAGKQCRIDFDNYYMYPGKYIISWVTYSNNSVDGVADYTSCNLDSNTNYYQYRRVLTDGTVQNFTRLPSIKLAYEPSQGEIVTEPATYWLPVVIIFAMISVFMSFIGVEFKRIQ